MTQFTDATSPVNGDWQAQWIAAEMARETFPSLPIFRRAFTVDKPMTRASVYVCGLGHFEVRVNSRKAGKDVLEPGWTNYRKTCLYVTHDITTMLHGGENVLGVMLGNGMYNVTGGRYKKFKGSFGLPRLILQMCVEYEDGTTALIVSDQSWKVAPGPITFSCIYGGEDHDANQEPLGWDLPAFDDSSWHNAAVAGGPGGQLLPQTAPPVRIMETINPVGAMPISPDVILYDLGRNFSGWPKIVVRGEAGAKITLITGELLDAAGRVTQKSSGSPVSFSYTHGGGEQSWHPRFSYTGFRYVEARGNVAAIQSLCGQFVHSSAAVVGEFSCAVPLFNKIHNLINAAILSNLQSVLTDCPHREKLGWLEQSHLMGPAIMFNYDVPLLYAKICRDMRDAQRPDGCVPTIAPEYVTFKGQYADFSDSPEWGSAAIINPWLLYQHYGDRQALEDNFQMMNRYAEYLHGRERDGIIEFGLGDWYDIGPGDPGYSKLTSKGLTGTAVYFRDIEILQKTAIVLDKVEEARRFTVWSSRIRSAFNQRFFNAESGQYDRGSQTAHAMALAMGLAAPADRYRVLDHLVRDIRAHDNHVTAGDIGFRFVLDALAEAGRSDVIYDMLCRTDPPSYGAQIAQSATTLTEAWDANPAKSQNHLMLGHAEGWFYQGLAGIQLDLSQALPRQIVIRPAMVGDIHWAQATYNSALGPIASRWERQDGRRKWSIKVPSHAIVYLPWCDAASPLAVEPGSHVFESDE